MRTVFSRLLIAILLALSGQNAAYAKGKGDFLGLFKLKNWAKDRLEITSGSDDTFASASAYTTVVIGLNKRLSEEGWRLLLYTDASLFEYTALKSYQKPNTRGHFLGHDQFAVDFTGFKQNADAMLGYQLRYDQIWFKLYAGATYEAENVTQTAMFRTDGMDFSPADYIIPEGDPKNIDAGTRWGGKVLGEAWMPLGGRAWTSLNASLSTINANYTASARLGYALPQWLSSKVTLAAGPETATFGNISYNALRAGAFARIGIWQQELTVSGGMSGNYGEPPSPYATLSLYRRF